MSLSPAAAATLAAWHQMVTNQDFSGLPALIHPDAVFRSPVKFSPYQGAPMLAHILRAASRTFEDFSYEREFADGKNSVGLEFAARVGDKQLKGIDLIEFADDGRMIAFEVMVRPASGLLALGEAMGRALAEPAP